MCSVSLHYRAQVNMKAVFVQRVRSNFGTGCVHVKLCWKKPCLHIKYMGNPCESMDALCDLAQLRVVVNAMCVLHARRSSCPGRTCTCPPAQSCACAPCCPSPRPPCRARPRCPSWSRSRCAPLIITANASYCNPVKALHAQAPCQKRKTVTGCPRGLQQLTLLMPCNALPLNFH